MPLAYIDTVDITDDGRLVVSGNMSSTGIEVSLTEYIYIVPPADGIWEYDLNVQVVNPLGLQVLVPFAIEAPWTGDKKAHGARVYHRDGSTPVESTTQLKAVKVDSYTTKQHNLVWLRAAHYDTKTDNLIIDLEYSGGCNPHRFSLEWDGSQLESSPPQYVLNLVDLTAEDPCEAIIPEQVRFDMDAPGISFERPSTLRVRTPGGGPELRIKLG